MGIVVEERQGRGARGERESRILQTKRLLTGAATFEFRAAVRFAPVMAVVSSTESKHIYCS